MRKYGKNKTVDLLLIIAACLLAFSMLFAITGSIYATTHEDSGTSIEEENLDDVPNIEIPEEAHAFKINSSWVYAYAGQTWGEWIEDDCQLGLKLHDEDRIYLNDGGSTYYLCLREYDEFGLPSDSPVTSSDVILFNVMYVLQVG